MSTIITATPLAGRVAIVTGASSGIGEATAFRLATLGAKVGVAARRTDNLEALAARITAAGSTALALPLDVTDRSAVNAAAQQVADRLGPVDLVFNNAGVQLISPIEDVRFDDWQQQIDLNVTGVMNVIGAFVPQLIDSAAEGKPADLITTSSIAGPNPFTTVNSAIFPAGSITAFRITSLLVPRGSTEGLSFGYGK